MPRELATCIGKDVGELGVCERQSIGNLVEPRRIELLTSSLPEQKLFCKVSAEDCR